MQKIIEGMNQALDHARGNDNATQTTTINVPNQIDVKSIRESLGLSQAEFSIRFGFNLSSLRNWEQGRRFPDGPARTLLKVIQADPSAVSKALAM